MTLLGRIQEAHYEGVRCAEDLFRERYIPHTFKDVVRELAGENVPQKPQPTLWTAFYIGYVKVPIEYFKGIYQSLMVRSSE